MGEIWKLGATCLGEEAIQDLLFTTTTTTTTTTTEQHQRLNGSVALLLAPSSSSSPSKPTDAEPALFVPEQGTSPLSKKNRRLAKKRAAFVEDGASQAQDKYGASCPTSFPHVLYQPSRFGFDATLHVPHGEFGEDIEDLY